MAPGAPKILEKYTRATRPISDRPGRSYVVDADDADDADDAYGVFMQQDSSDPMQNSNGCPKSTGEEAVSMLDKAVSMLDKAISVLDKAGSVLEKTAFVWDKAVIVWDKAFILLRKLRGGTGRVIPHADHHTV